MPIPPLYLQNPWLNEKINEGISTDPTAPSWVHEQNRQSIKACQIKSSNLCDSHGCRWVRSICFKELGHLMLSYSEGELLPTRYLGCSQPRSEQSWDTVQALLPRANPPTCSFLSILSISAAKAFSRLSLRSFPSEPALLFASVWPGLRLNSSACLLQIPPHLSLLGVPPGNLLHS